VVSTLKLLLAIRASVQNLGQGNLKFFDMEVDVNRRLMSLISTNIVRALGGASASRFFDQANLGATAFENDVGGDRA
jgi:hypothetical protein